MRDVIKVRAVRFSLEDDIGYIKINSFTERTTDDLEAAIARMREEAGDTEYPGLRPGSEAQSGRPARPGGQRRRCLPWTAARSFRRVAAIRAM